MSDRAGLLSSFCSLTPVADAPALESTLASWGRGPDSPFARVPGTHFARFVVLSDLRREEVAQPADALPSPYLMFSAFFDGDPALWLEALCASVPDAADAVWRCCAGHPGHPARHGHLFRRWLCEHRVEATGVFAASPDASLADVREALAFRERFRAFAAARQGASGHHRSFADFAREQP